MAKQTTITDLFPDAALSSGAIRNEFGDDRDNKSAVSVIEQVWRSIPTTGAEISMDDLSSSDLETVEGAISKLHSETQSHTLLLSIAVYQMTVNEVYKPHYDSAVKYFEAAPGRLNMSKAEFSNAMAVGSAFSEHHKSLLSAGFRPNGDTTKLRYLSRAIDLHGKDDAIRQLPQSTKQEFIDWAIGDAPTPLSLETTHQNISVTTSDKGILLNDRLVIKASEVRKIVERGGLPYVVELYSEAEARVVNRALKQHREKK